MIDDPFTLDNFVAMDDCPYTDVEDMNQFRGKGLHCLHLNIRRLIKNESNLKSLLDDLNSSNQGH